MHAVRSFPARLTPSAIHRGDCGTGRYTRLSDCLVEIDGLTPRRRTAMAFGSANASVTRRLAVGRPVTLSCEWDGPILRIVGWPPAGNTTKEQNR